jgi:hypothetical protein
MEASILTAETLLPLAVGAVLAGILIQYTKPGKTRHHERERITSAVRDYFRNAVVAGAPNAADHNQSQYNNMHTSMSDSRGIHIPHDHAGHRHGVHFHAGLSKTADGRKVTVSRVNQMSDSVHQRPEERKTKAY